MIKTEHLKPLSDLMNSITDIPEEELEKLLKRAGTLSLKKNQFFLRAGEVPERIALVVSGLLRLFYIDSEGTEINKHFCAENMLAISYSAFLLRRESMLYIQALEDTKLIIIDYDTYIDLLNSGSLCWQVAIRKLTELLYVIKEKREYELLTYDAQQRYTQFLNDYPDIEKRITQYHIASYLAITPESLSRIRSNLKLS